MIAAYLAPISDAELKQATSACIRLHGQFCCDGISCGAIEQDFACIGDKVSPANRAVGIFKHELIACGARSFKTTKFSVGRQSMYADADGVNRVLRECLGSRLPRMYFNSAAERVPMAYGARLVMMGLPVPVPLELAHIVPDPHEQIGVEVNDDIGYLFRCFFY